MALTWLSLFVGTGCLWACVFVPIGSYGLKRGKPFRPLLAAFLIAWFGTFLALLALGMFEAAMR